MNIDSIYSSAGLPQLGDVVAGWARPITIGLVTKEMFNGEVQETIEELEGMGVIQPFTAQQLLIKPEGQRTWDWSGLHCLPGIELSLDDVVEIYGRRFRVMAKRDYTLYGYLRYELIQGYIQE